LLAEIKDDFRYVKGTQNLYRERGGTTAIVIPRNELIEERAVRRLLRRAKRTDEQIDAFIESCREEES